MGLSLSVLGHTPGTWEGLHIYRELLYLGKVIQHQDYSTEGEDVTDAFFSFVAPKTMIDIKRLLLLLVLDYIPT